jgi:hypothetical protein
MLSRSELRTQPLYVHSRECMRRRVSLPHRSRRACFIQGYHPVIANTRVSGGTLCCFFHVSKSRTSAGIVPAFELCDNRATISSICSDDITCLGCAVSLVSDASRLRGRFATRGSFAKAAAGSFSVNALSDSGCPLNTPSCVASTRVACSPSRAFCCNNEARRSRRLCSFASSACFRALSSAI